MIKNQWLIYVPSLLPRLSGTIRSGAKRKATLTTRALLTTPGPTEPQACPKFTLTSKPQQTILQRKQNRNQFTTSFKIPTNHNTSFNKITYSNIKLKNKIFPPHTNTTTSFRATLRKRKSLTGLIVMEYFSKSVNKMKRMETRSTPWLFRDTFGFEKTGIGRFGLFWHSEFCVFFGFWFFFHSASKKKAGDDLG